jgi:hypothetical protein
VWSILQCQNLRPTPFNTREYKTNLKKLVGDKRSSLFCIAVSNEVFFIQLPPNDIHETEKENNITKAQTNTMTWLRILCTAVNKLECLNLQNVHSSVIFESLVGAYPSGVTRAKIFIPVSSLQATMSELPLGRLLPNSQR